MRRYLSALLLILLCSSTVMADENNTGRISGAWIPHKMAPISGGLIYAFDTNSGPPPQRARTRRVPEALAVTDNKGKFSLELAEGTYYLSTLKKNGEATPGPPQEGDLYGLSRDKKGNLIIYTVKRGKTTHIGILRRATVYRSHDTKTVYSDTASSDNVTGISGTLKKFDNTPMADAVVQVYDNQDLMGKPIYVSHKTGKDGKYRVNGIQEGTYFITVRAEYGTGRPKSGDTYGIYGGDSAQPVIVKDQHVSKDIDIQVGVFVDNRPK